MAAVLDVNIMISCKQACHFCGGVNNKATFYCLMKMHGFLTPNFWIETRFCKSPFQEFTDLLARKSVTKPLVLKDAERVEA